MNGRTAALRAALRPPLLTRSLAVAVVVGTVLNLINQGDRLAAGAPLDWGKLALTFVVPFVVASYGAWSALAPQAEDQQLSPLSRAPSAPAGAPPDR